MTISSMKYLLTNLLQGIDDNVDLSIVGLHNKYYNDEDSYY